MATDDTTTAVADDEWEVKPPPKQAGGNGEWSVSPPAAPAAPNPKTGAGMEGYALQQAHSMFTPNQVTGQTSHGQPIYDKPPNPIDKAADETSARQVRLGAAENRAEHSIHPFTNASMALTPASGIGESIASRGLGPTIMSVAHPIARTVVGAGAGAYAGGHAGKYLFGQAGETPGKIIGGLAGGMGLGGIGGGKEPEPAPFSNVSESSGPYRGPSSVQSPFEVPASSSAKLSPRIAPGPSLPEGGLPAAGPRTFNGGGGDQTLVVPEPRQPLPGDKPGAMWSVGREDTLEEAAKRGAPGAGDVKRNIGQPILYAHREGVGYPGPRQPTPEPATPAPVPVPQNGDITDREVHDRLLQMREEKLKGEIGKYEGHNDRRSATSPKGPRKPRPGQ